jgi:hypothetical protein
VYYSDFLAVRFFSAVLDERRRGREIFPLLVFTSIGGDSSRAGEAEERMYPFAISVIISQFLAELGVLGVRICRL